MLCPYCVNGFVYKTVFLMREDGEDKHKEEYEKKVLCDECGGYGIIHCCEGLICNE